mmetsp:Transcript_8225/g.32450  ORF Transcript_8225/g.32450 Transcript_8225/m.32450 type:complete len:84 (+) Transcript_8225:299-550(+)
MRRLLRLPRAAAANSADVLEGVLGGFAIPSSTRRSGTLTKLSTIRRPIRHRAAVARSRVLSPPTPSRVYDRLGRGLRVSRRGA